MSRRSAWAGWIAFLLLPAAASAQDYGKDWVDRITHELLQEDAPLSAKPLTWKAAGGELYSYDRNILLTDTNHKADSILITFADVGLNYAKPSFDLEADLEANYNYYIHHDEFNADEERFFGRMRYVGPKIMLQLAEIARRETSPTDVVFADRVSRFLSNTTPLVAYHFTGSIYAEAQSDFQIVKFNRQVFESADNYNSRSTLTLGAKTSLTDLDAIVQGGYLTITYNNSFGPPDATGFFGRAGMRGEALPGLNVIVLGGYTKASSDDFTGTSINEEMSTGDVEIHLAYTASPKTTLYADYSRRITFSAGVPFEVVDASDIIVEIALRDNLKARGRLQYDRAHAPTTPSRSYYSGTVGVNWQPKPHVLLDISFTYRAGAAVQPGGGGDFEDYIGSAGIAVTY